MENEEKRAAVALNSFSSSLDNLQRAIRPMISALQGVKNLDEDDTDPLTRARIHITLTYTVNTLFYMYLRAQGIDPTKHPVSDELVRVQDAFLRLRKVEKGLSADHQRLPSRQPKEFLAQAEKAAAKLAVLIFPEEARLLNSLRNSRKASFKDVQPESESDVPELFPKDSQNAEHPSDSSPNDRPSRSNANGPSGMNPDPATNKTDATKQAGSQNSNNSSGDRPKIGDGEDIPDTSVPSPEDKNEKNKKKKKKKRKNENCESDAIPGNSVSSPQEEKKKKKKENGDSRSKAEGRPEESQLVQTPQTIQSGKTKKRKKKKALELEDQEEVLETPQTDRSTYEKTRKKRKKVMEPDSTEKSSKKRKKLKKI